MVYSGGPFIQIGQITLSANTIGPLNIPYSRVSDTLQLIMENKLTSEFTPFEWWFDYAGNLYIDQKRGSDKSATVHLVAGDQIDGSRKEQISKQTSQRVRVVGRGESADQDTNTSDWHENQTELDNVNSFYEKIETEKSLSSKDEADIWAQVLLAQNSPIRKEITILLENDFYTANDYDLGDEVTATDPATGISGVNRVKTIEKWINSGGETVQVTVSKRRTDIIDRLSNLFKMFERMKNSSTYLDVLYGEGGKQTQIDPEKVEDVWSQTASNKWATDLPEDETDATDIMEDCVYVGRGTISWACDKEEFEVYCDVVDGAGEVFLFDPLLKFSRDPRFTCEFEIDTTGEDRTEWDVGDQAYIRIREINTLCGGADPTNPDKHCCLPYGSASFGFYLTKTASNYELKAVLDDGVIFRVVKMANITIDTKYIIEARMEWKERVVKYYFGKSDVDKDDQIWGFRLRAILPISLVAQDEDDLCPFHIVLDATGAAETSKIAIVIYRWKTQAIRAVE